MRAIVAVLALLVALLPGGRAEAHAELVAADPAAGSVVAVAPAAATLAFSEPVAPLALRWFRSDAAPAEAEARAEGSRLVVPLPPGPVTGTLVLSWRVVSADGHPVGGSHAFSVGTPTPVAPAPAATTAWPAAVAHGALTVALAFGVGGAAFLRLVDAGPPLPRARRLALLAAAAGPPLALVACGLHGLDLTGGPPADLLGAAPWRAALASPFAATAAASALAALLALAALRGTGTPAALTSSPAALGANGKTSALPGNGAPGPSRARGCRAAALALAGWALAAGGFALFGHAASAPPRWLTAPAVAVHAAAFLFWVGALPGLAEAATAGRQGPEASLASRLRRFSRVAVPLVALLVASGAALTAVQLGTPAALLGTAYGRLLAAKLAAAALLLAVAIHNRFRLTPAIAAGRPGAAGRLRRSVLAEIALALLILALASGFRLLPPPRTAAAPPAPAHAHLHGQGLMASVTVAPGRAAADAVAIALLPPSGSALQPKEVRIAFADEARGVEPIRLSATGAGTRWHAGPLLLPHGGTWALSLDVLVDDFTEQSLHGTIDISPAAPSTP